MSSGGPSAQQNGAVVVSPQHFIHADARTRCGGYRKNIRIPMKSLTRSTVH